MRQNPLWIVKHRGLRGTLRWLRRSTPYYLWLYLTPDGRRELHFDRLHGVETEGLVPRWKMGDVGPNLCHAVQYLPTKPKKFWAMLDSLPIDCSEFTFVDIGCGKGRVLLLAAEYPFRRIIGVEFVPELCEIARRNLGDKAEVLCMDATAYQFPLEPLVIYLCNPFDGELMQRFAANLEASLEVCPRPVYVLYWNALYPEAFREWHTMRLRREEYAIFTRQFAPRFQTAKIKISHAIAEPTQ